MRTRKFLPAATVLLAVALPLQSFAASAARLPMLRAAASQSEEIGAYELTMDNVSRFYAAMFDISERSKSDAAFKAKLDKLGSGAGSPEDMGKAMFDDADVNAILTRNGFADGKDFIYTQFAYLQASTAAGLIKAGGDKASTIAQVKCSEANLTFVTEHSAELKALDAKYPNPGVQAP